MRRDIRKILAVSVLVLVTSTIGVAQEAAGEKSPLLDPSAATATAPAAFKVKVVTSAGDFVIEVHRDWSPAGADRFYNLVRIGYYEGAAFYRVIRDPSPFMAQVGFSPDPRVNAAWRDATIADDPMKMSNKRGMVSFAKSNAPNSRTTQFFVNYSDNAYLDSYGFSPFGQVVEGMEAADSLYSGYGEGAPQGKGPNQGQIAREGKAYLEAEYPKLDVIISAEIVE